MSLILTDLSMPVLDGIALYVQLQADSALRAIPVLFMSANPAYPGIKEHRRGERLIVKPFTTDNLLARIARLLSISSAPAAI